MHTEMDSEIKNKALDEMIGEDERCIARAGGHLELPKEGAARRLWDNLMSAGGGAFGYGIRNDAASEGLTERNFYIALTDRNLHLILLQHYNPDLVSGRVTIPLDDISDLQIIRGHRNHVKFMYDGQPVTMMIPSGKGLTKLKDQKEEAEELLDSLEERIG